MDIKAIKALASAHSSAELEKMATQFEESGIVPEPSTKSPEEYLSDLLQACEVKRLVESGQLLSDAIREFSKRVRGSINT